jgi:hypothetical protein
LFVTSMPKRQAFASGANIITIICATFTFLTVAVLPSVFTLEIMITVTFICAFVAIILAGIPLSTLPRPVFTCMMILNVIGIFAYLGYASDCWIEPELANVAGASGGAAIVWGISAYPILLLFFALNSIWVFVASFRYFRKKIWTLHPVVLLVPIMWDVAIHVDFSHHGI